MDMIAAADEMLARGSALSGLHDFVWSVMAAGVRESGHPWSYGSVSTVAKRVDGSFSPRSRIVILRGVDPTSRSLDFYTDVRSAKVDEIFAASSVSWLFYDVESKIQLRLEGTAEVVQGAIADAAWSATPLASRAAYLSITRPGNRASSETPPDVSDRSTSLEDSERGRLSFRVVRTTVQRIDWLYLRGAGHVRAEIEYDPTGTPSVTWLVP